MTTLELCLLGTSGCHLCEQALAILNQCSGTYTALLIEPIDIAEATEWQSQYATRIPVLYHRATQKDLGWPFDRANVNAFIEALNHD